jgi:plastocyanin
MRALSILVFISAILIGCGGGGAADLTTPSNGAPASLALSPAAPSVAVGGRVQLTVSGKDASGTAIPDLPAPSFSIADQTVATVDATGLVTALAVGTTEVTATVEGAGAVTATLTVTAPGTAAGPTVATPNETFSPATVTTAPGTTVTWEISGATHNVTFTGPAPAGGNIPDTPAGNRASRTFDAAGTYSYQCTRHSGMTGTVVVESGAPPPAPTPQTPQPPGPAQPPAPPTSATTVTTPNETFSPGTVTIAPGGTVAWQISGARHNVTFTGTAPAGGDIPDTEPGNTVSRTFDAAGIYGYQCTRHSGMTGVVVVDGGGGALPSNQPPPPPPFTGATITVEVDGFSPEEVTIALGESVTWQFAAADGITFEEDSVAGGNIPFTQAGAGVSRTFQVAGDYKYASLRDGNMEGRIRVR